MEGKTLEPLKTNRWSTVKGFLSVFLPYTALLVGISIIIHYTQVRSERIVIESREKDTVALARKVIDNEFVSVVSDLVILSKNRQLQKFLQTREQASLEALAEEFLLYCKNKGLYDQVRFLDETGMEIVRINFNNGKPNIVPKDQLQNKSRRYYFRDVFQMEHSEVFVSPFDLNIERGEIEIPLKPMLRFGTPVFDINGQKRGIVLLNYLGAKLINDFEEAVAVGSSQFALLNSDGFWLKGPRSEDEWGFMYEDGSSRKFVKTFPEAWQRIQKAEYGQFESVEGMFTFTTIYPLAMAQKSSTGSGRAFNPSDVRITGKDYYWKVVSHVSSDLLNAESRVIGGRLAIFALFAIVVMTIISWFLSRANINRKQVEESFKRSEERYRSIFESIQDVYAEVSVEDGTILEISPSIERVSGYSREEMLGKSMATFYANLATRQGLLAALKERGSVNDYEVELINKQGLEVPCSFSVKIVTDPAGKPDKIVGTVRDISGRKRAEESLRKAHDELEQRVKERTIELVKEVEQRKKAQEQIEKSKMMLQSIFDGISEPLIMVDNEMRLMMLNTAAMKYYKISNFHESLGSSCKETIGKGSSTCQGCKIVDATLKGQYEMFERQSYIYKDIMEQITVYPINDGENDGRSAIIRVRDITDQKMIERQLIHNEKLAALGLLVAGIAHEINNPNNFITFNIPILNRYVMQMLPVIEAHVADHPDFKISAMPYDEFREDIFELLENIEHGSMRINKAVSNLRKFSRVRDKIKPTWVDVVDVVEKAVSICHGKIIKSVKSFKTDIPKDLPRIHTDPDSLEQVVVNLLINAAQAANKDESWIKLAVSADNSAPGEVTLEVADNGCGIDEEIQKRIFNPFFTTKTSGEGTGLGLYLCQNLLEAMGGRIEVVSKPDIGTSFKVCLNRIKKQCVE